MMIVEFDYNRKHYCFEHFDNDYIGLQQKKYKQFYEQKLLREIKKRKLNGIYVDVGANVGNHSVFFASQCKADKIIAIEGNKNNFKLLAKNTQQYQNVECIYGVVADKTQMVKLCENPYEENNCGTYHIEFDENGQKSVTIDEICTNENKISVIKLDIEGYESFALLGALETINKHKPLMTIEAVDLKNLQEHCKILVSLGYKITNHFAGISTYMWEYIR